MAAVCSGLRARTHLGIDVRLRNAQLLEESARHGAVVILASMYQPVPEVAAASFRRLQRVDNRRDLHKVGARAGNEVNGFQRFLPPIRVMPYRQGMFLTPQLDATRFRRKLELGDLSRLFSFSGNHGIRRGQYALRRVAHVAPIACSPLPSSEFAPVGSKVSRAAHDLTSREMAAFSSRSGHNNRPVLVFFSIGR